MILIPRYKPPVEVLIPDLEVARYQGEYRAVLQGSDGAIKYDSGWQPNMYLDSGVGFMINPYEQGLWSIMLLGDSDTAVAGAQTNIQGTLLGTVGPDTNQGTTNWKPTAPNYEWITTQVHVFPPGAATGTIREFALAKTANPLNNATIRAVLTAPIVKGASDQLTMYHRDTRWWFLGVATGVVNFAGEDWDWSARLVNLDGGPNGPGSQGADNVGRTNATLSYYNSDQYVSQQAGVWGGSAATDFSATPLTDPVVTNKLAFDSGLNYAGATSTVTNVSIGGTLPNYHCDRVLKWGVDQANGTTSGTGIGMIAFSTAWGGWFDSFGYSREKPIQIKLRRVSDGSVLVKENTHEFTCGVRIYAGRYTP